MNKTYAGIGGRNTPLEIALKMIEISSKLSSLDYTLRSGGANGADSAFETGCHANKEIYLPWKKFNNNLSDLYLPWNIDKMFLDIIKQVNPEILNCSHAVISLHARNCQQILGEHLDSPCDFVLCWTDRDRTWFGGTMFAIKLAELNHIPVINMLDKEWENKLNSIIGDIPAKNFEDISKVKYDKVEMPDYGDYMSIDEFINSCKEHDFIDYDGYGNLCINKRMTKTVINPSDVTNVNFKINKTYDGVIWFNR